MERPDKRACDQLRPISFIPNVAPHATGSCLVSFGNTSVICAATIEDGVPGWMKYQKVEGGWLTAEYSMLPYSTLSRKPRDINRGKLDGRSSEIQRLIGRSLRAVVDLKALGPRTLWIDCDFLRADGGTRTASITGAMVALVDAIRHLQRKKAISGDPLLAMIASVSVGVYKGVPVLDLDYAEDSNAETDMNVVMNGQGGFIEVQGTAEAAPFSTDELNEMLELAKRGIADLVRVQNMALAQ